MKKIASTGETKRDVVAFTVRVPGTLLTQIDAAQVKYAKRVGLNVSRNDFMNMLLTRAVGSMAIADVFAPRKRGA